MNKRQIQSAVKKVFAQEKANNRLVSISFNRLLTTNAARYNPTTGVVSKSEDVVYLSGLMQNYKQNQLGNGIQADDIMITVVKDELDDLLLADISTLDKITYLSKEWSIINVTTDQLLITYAFQLRATD